MTPRERGKRNAAIVTGALIAAALGGTAAVVLAVPSASATANDTSTSDNGGGLSLDDRGGPVHGRSGGS